MVKKGSWVQIHNIVLKVEERAPFVPQDTAQVPLEMWVKGTLLNDAEVGDMVRIKTVTNRIEVGKLVAVNPTFKHNYGDCVPEIIKIGTLVKEIVFGDDQV